MPPYSSRMFRISRPFVGRERELDALVGVISHALERGGPAAAVVIAEPGLGKTRLLAEALPRLELPALQLQGYEPAQEIPLGAAGTLLRELARAPRAGGRLDALLFGETGPGLETLRVFEAAFRCLKESAPLLVVLDDLQWADSETLALLHYLLRAARQSNTPLLVVCASRPAAAAETFTTGLGGFLSSECLAELRLAPLDREEGIELAMRLAPQLTREQAEAFWRKAQGSPFWLEALAVEGGDGASATRLIRGRYASLDGEATRLFALLVVAAQPLTSTEVAELLEWDSDRVERAGLALANRGLAVLQGGSLRTAHDLIRETAERELSGTERRRLHARLAGWFEAGAGDELETLSQALAHRRAAGLAAVELALHVARSPRRRLLGLEGLAMLGGIAEEALDGDGLVLRQEVAALAEELGEWRLAVAHWAAVADRLPSPNERARALLGAARAECGLEQPVEAHAFLARGRAACDGDPLLEIELDVREAQVLRWLEDRNEEAELPTLRAAAAGRLLVEAAGGSDRLAEPARRAYQMALRAQLDSAIHAEATAEVARIADEIGAIARDPVEALTAALDATFVLMLFDGLPLPAEPRIRQVLEESRRLVLPSIEAEALMWLSEVLFDTGRLADGAALAWEAVELAERVGAPDRIPLAQMRAGAHYRSVSRGEWQRGVAGIAEQIPLCLGPHTRLDLRMAYFSLLARFAPEKAAAEVRAQIAATAEDAEVAGCERCRWESVLVTAEARARLGDLEAARTALEQWDTAHPEPRPGQTAWRAHAEALIAARIDAAGSLTLFEQAAELAERAGQRHTKLWIELDRAAAVAAVDRTNGVQALRAVAREAEAMGALTERQLAVQKLRELGVRTWQRRGGGDPLTSRELEVVRLVADGASNPEIAASLFLSRKTVERHVSNILRKLDARNRIELASRLSRVRAAEDGGARR